MRPDAFDLDRRRDDAGVMGALDGEQHGAHAGTGLEGPHPWRDALEQHGEHRLVERPDAVRAAVVDEKALPQDFR